MLNINAVSATSPVTENVLGRGFQGVLFDMDGTLIDSTPAVNRSWLRWAAERGLDEAFRTGNHGKPARQIVESLVPEGYVEEALARVLALETVDTHDITVLPGAAELLLGIPDARRAIVTSCAGTLAAARIAASGLAAPSVVVTIDDTSRGKPNPDPFLEGAVRLGVDPRHCVVIEDAPAGLTAARAAGCATIAVVGTHTADDLVADLVLPSLDRLRATVTDEGVVFSLRR
ncbi:HAD family hydrolase [Cryobacterium psychrophilum]|uniref:HAD family hydrolase n=1 Tax=Cryobacterium psychrophilum TaxID=41988 RepID=A0A4Y8KNV6_9MICO|nr:HAD-IA family hydrolase [Cryobacterium psychrophilum]TDW29322.1 sugar-phosphatase [Cryobacterium psychrophilum]TFD79996.1 HAD family hydrolase [Cryobacterium psychrophilum]